MALNILQCKEECTTCIRNYSRKHKLQRGDTFDIACNGIPKQYVNKTAGVQLELGIDPETLLNPIKWAAEVLDWHCEDPDGSIWAAKNPEEYNSVMSQSPGRPSKYHRTYQQVMLSCTARRKVFRCGRQIGKCLPSGTLIQMADGAQKPIEEVQDGDLVVSFDENYRSINTPAFRACNGEKSVARLTLMDGRSVEATYNHPFLTRTKVGREPRGTRRAIFQDEWKPLEEIVAGDYVAVPAHILILGKENNLEQVYSASQDKKSSPGTESYEDGDLVFIKVRSIEATGTKMTWDLSVPETKNFIANNIVTHNTEVLIISMLFHLFVNDGFKIILITPYQSQIDLIFKRLAELIEKNPTLQNSIKRSVKAPQYTIELYNGSQIKGFTAGTKSGGGAGAARGQCLAKGTEVRLFNGLTKNIEDIKVGDAVVSYNNNWESVPAVVTHVFPSEEKELFKLITASGREIELSKDHKLFTVDGERALKDIGIGDLIAIPKKIKTKAELSINDNLIKATAYLIGDGYISTNKISFCSANPVTQGEFISLFPRKDLRKETKPGNAASDFILRGESKKKLRLEMKEMGLLDSHSWNKFIPNSILSLPQEKLSLFLSRLYSTDGWASSGSNNTLEIGYCTTSKKLADDLVYLLSRFGIVGRIKKRSKILDGKHCRKQYIVSIKNSEDIQLFIEKIGIYGKEAAISEIKEACSLKDSAKVRGVYACSREFLITTLSKYGFSYKSLRNKYGLRVYSKEYVSIDTLSKYASLTKIPELLNLLNQDVFWDKVISVSPSGVQKSFDIEVKSTSKFIANGIVVHNSANMLVFDEADYLNPEDMDAAMSIITNFPDATVWMSSTPSGKRERFYDACHSRDWKEYHFPSSVNPNWSEELDKLFRGQLTQVGYQHEIDAEFGSQEEGVFQAGYVEAAMSKYDYSEMRPSNNWLYSIGVDWNSIKNGTTICVTGFNPSQNKFYVVERAVVQREGWTQLAACEKIVEMNRKWSPFAIYVDSGYGSVQVEVLHKYGHEARADPERGRSHIDAKLPKILKPFEFGGTIEVRDPFTREKIKKPAKGFLVENSIRRFESRDILFPETDETLEKELLNYIIKNITQSGQVVYGVNDINVGDHNLDALMLSLVAFTLEKTSFGNMFPAEKVAFTNIEERPNEDNWIPVNITKKPNRRDQATKMLPDTDRTNFEAGSNSSHLGSLPAANLNPEHSNQLKLWEHPGWDRDLPAPTQTRTKSRGNVLSRRASPTRKHF